MPIIGRLVEFYRAQGIDICTGLSTVDFDGLPTAPFTRFFRDGRSVTEGLGIALQEVYFFETLFATYRPRRVLIIGNSQGWSTLAIGLLLPDSRVVAMDAAFADTEIAGIQFTNRIATQYDVPVRAVKGVSPQDVSSVVDAELGGSLDFAFIDGEHTNEQVVLDYKAVAGKASSETVYLFHDVRLFHLFDGMRQIERMAGRIAHPLWGTPSGMMMLYDKGRHPELVKAVAPFVPSPEALAAVRREGWVHRHPHHARLRRSIVKRLNVLRRLAGAELLPLPLKT